MTVDDLRGRRLGGFELLDPLGQGSFGSVWRARQIRLDRDVAVKVLDPLVARDPDAARRFEREGRSAASLDHPSIVPVYEAGDDDGLYYLAMRLVDGETLASAIEREGPMPLERVVDLLAPIAAALDSAHATGLIHRDVKPANILIEDGRPYLSDFGIAASARELGRYTTGSIGTAEYMAPEQARGEAVDHRSDLYALGCVAFQSLTGTSPFERDDVVSTLVAHSTDDIPLAGDERLDQFFAQALAKAPDDRFDSGAEFIAALGGTVAAAAAPSPLPAPESARSMRRPTLIAAGLAFLVVIAGLLVVSQRGDTDSPTASEPPAATTQATTADTLIESATSPPDTSAADTAVPTDTAADPDAAAVAFQSGGSVEVGTTLRLDDPNPHSNLDAAKLLAEWVLPVMYRIDEQLDAVPSLATGPPVASDDGATLTWTIHDDRVWNDGTPVTTADIVATYEYLSAADTSALSTALYDGVATVDALDATTLQITLTQATGAEYLMFSTIHPIIKSAAWRDHLAAGETATTFLVGGVDFAAGPYQLATRQNPGEIALSRNPEWTGDEPPLLDRIAFASYRDAAELIEAQTLGQVDMIWIDDVSGSEVFEVDDIADTEILVDDSNVAVQLSLNVQRAPLQDPLVRRAILHAIDRDVIVDTAVGRKTNTIAEPWNSLVFAPGQAGDEQPFADAFDVDEANRLLDEAGWVRPNDDVFRRKDGEDLALTIVLNNDNDSVNTALAIEESLQSIGIDITGTPASSELTNERMAAGAFDLLLQFRLFNNDPIATDLSFGASGCPESIAGCNGNGVNFGGFSDAEIEAALALADSTADPVARIGIYTDIDLQFVDLVPAVPLYVEPAFTAYRNDVGGVSTAPNVGPIVSLDQWGFLASP
jgi:ABC-type transport system substrate-binding protein